MSEEYREERKRYLAEQAERNRGYVWTVEEGEFAGVYRDMEHLLEVTEDRVKVLLDEWIEEHGCDCMVSLPWLKGRHPDPDKPIAVMSGPIAICGWCLVNDHTDEEYHEL